MKTIGLIGGMSWESTAAYYRIINETVNRELGGLHSARLILYSVDFDEIEKCQSSGDWDKCAEILLSAATGLEKAGVEFIVICTNTMHKVFDSIQAGIGIPIIHIAVAAAQALKAQGFSCAGLLGTKYTMTQDFYKEKLMSCGISVIVPDDSQIETVNRVIFDELCLGKISDTSKTEFLYIIDSLAARGAECVILGCTEIGMLITQEDTALPVFDTTQIHANHAAMLSIERLANKAL